MPETGNVELRQRKKQPTETGKKNKTDKHIQKQKMHRVQKASNE
jgi:hypothetical protein